VLDSTIAQWASYAGGQEEALVFMESLLAAMAESCTPETRATPDERAVQVLEADDSVDVAEEATKEADRLRRAYRA
jgi:hypothetical protein